MNEHEASIRQAIFTKERQTSSLRRIGVATLALSPIAAVALLTLSPTAAVPWRQDQPFHYLIGAFWALAVMLPAGWWFLRRYVPHAVEVIVGDPERYVRTQERPASILWLADYEMYLLSGFWLSIASLITFVAPMLALLVVLNDAPPALLVTFIFGSGLQSFCDAEVWRRYGHRAVLEEAGIDSAQVMTERGYRWTWWAGWLRAAESDSMPTGASSSEQRGGTGDCTGPERQLALKCEAEQVRSDERAVHAVAARWLLVLGAMLIVAGVLHDDDPIKMAATSAAMLLGAFAGGWIGVHAYQGRVADEIKEQPSRFTRLHYRTLREMLNPLRSGPHFYRSPRWWLIWLPAGIAYVPVALLMFAADWSFEGLSVGVVTFELVALSAGAAMMMDAHRTIHPDSIEDGADGEEMEWRSSER